MVVEHLYIIYTCSVKIHISTLTICFKRAMYLRKQVEVMRSIGEKRKGQNEAIVF